MPRKLNRIWDDVRRGENVDLYTTVVIAVGLAALNLLGIASQNLIAPITLAVLGLLAIATLGTRHHTEEQLQKLATFSGAFLRGRSEMPPFEERGQVASEIVIVGVSLISAIVPHLDFWERKMKDNCKLKFLLLNPESSSVDIWNSINKVPDVQRDIQQTLKTLRLLIQMEETCSGKCEVRLSSVFLPFSLVAFDPTKDVGVMNVEMYAYKRTLGERPHFLLTRARDNKWFKFFLGQFEQLWSDSTLWEPIQT